MFVRVRALIMNDVHSRPTGGGLPAFGSPAVVAVVAHGGLPRLPPP